jgi:hypothetical protein
MTIAEIGDAACKILITGGGLLLLVFPVLWIVHWMKGDTKKRGIYIEED